MKTLDRNAKLGVLAEVKKQVTRRHFNLFAVDHRSWCANIDSQSEALARATDHEFEVGVRKLLSDLKTSHTTFYRSVPTAFPSQHTIGATFRRSMDGGWDFLDVFEQSPADKAGIRPGDRLAAIDNAPPTGEETPSFGIGRTHRLAIQRDGKFIEIEVQVPPCKATISRPPLVEPLPVTTRMIAQGEGVLTVRYFPGIFGIGFSRQLDEAIAHLKASGCKRLTVDLSGNIGGSLGFARLASYLVPDRRPIGFNLTPERLRSGYSAAELPQVPMPSTRLGLATTFARFIGKDKSLMLLTQGLGPQPFHDNLTVRINEWTTSAGEIVAAFAAANGIPIEGTKTKGSVLGATNLKVGPDCWLRLPVMGWFAPDGAIIEGVGVEPDCLEKRKGKVC